MLTGVPAAWPPGVEVLAIDLDVRERSRVAIDPHIRELSRDAAVFLKIDSTLRGPVASLIESALRVSGRSIAMVAPAFPEQGRTVVDGQLIVNGEAGPRVSDVVGDGPHVVVDSEQLVQLARDAEQHPEWLLVGSAGLARRLAPTSAPPHVRRHGSVLVVAGSPTPITREQLAMLHGMPGLDIIATEPTDARDSGEAARAIAEIAARTRPEAVVLTGGATARAVIHQVQAKHVRVLGELQPGIPIGKLEDGLWQGVTVVTKAGGFGTPSTLLDVVRALGPSSRERGLRETNPRHHDG